jgi:hypothetical protein
LKLLGIELGGAGEIVRAKTTPYPPWYSAQPGDFPMRLLAVELAFALFMASFASTARGGGHTGGHSSVGPGGKGGNSGSGCPSGARSHSSGTSIHELDAYRRDAFQRRNPCPSTGKTYGQCPGYVVRDVAPEHRGDAWTMRWMTTEEAGKSPDSY